ncbi:MAG: hypothetical protein U0529_14105 [Thermoanaerobaculia bacterium]
MRRTIPGLLLSLLLVGCDAVWTPEQQLTKQVLVDTQMVRAAAAYQVERYSEVLKAAATAADPARQSAQDLAAYFASPESQVVGKLLAEVLKPTPADASFKRAKEIDEVKGAMAALAALALRPQGSWDGWTRQVDGARSRLDRAAAALEAGQKSYVMIDVRQEANIKTAAFTASLGKARSGAEGAPKAQ